MGMRTLHKFQKLGPIPAIKRPVVELNTAFEERVEIEENAGWRVSY
jgi:hypothetical protein